MKKRVLATLLSLCMILALLPTAAVAADKSGVTQTVQADISLKDGTNAAITETGDLYVWGDTLGERSLLLQDVEKVNSSYCAIAAITKSGNLYLCGDWGSLNYLDQSHQDKNGFFKLLSGVTDVQLGSGWHGAALTKNGDLYLWGRNDQGQIGDGTTLDRSSPVKVLSNIDRIQLGDGQWSEDCSMAIDKDKNLYMWGDNHCGQIGNGTKNDQLTPQKILSNVSAVDSSFGTTVALTQNGDLYIWGDNFHGEVGDGTTVSQLSPKKVLSDISVMNINGGTVAAVTQNGDLYMWGQNYNGEVGNGTMISQLYPQKIMSNISTVDLSSDGTSAAITKSGDLYVWGANDCGQVGNGTTQDQLSPLKIMSDIIYVKCSLHYIGAVTKNHDLYTWGGATSIILPEMYQLTPKKELSNIRISDNSGDAYLQIYATDEDMRIEEGEKISILCKLYQSGRPVQNWERPVFIIDRDDVLSMSDETPKSGGYSFDVTGKKEGTAVLTVSDADTGASASISIEVGSADPYSYTIASVPSYFPNEIFDDKIQTNFYNVNGLYVNGYTYSKKSGSYQVSFNAYNRTHMYGSVDVYDKDGRWIQSKRIDRYKEISSLSDTGGALWDLVVDAINGRYFVYTAKTYTAETNVQISVPEGGYFVISNNMAESPGTFLYNSVRFMALGTKQVLKLASNEFDIQKLSDDLVGKAIKNPSFLDVFHDSFHDIAKDTTLNLLEDGLISSYGNVAGSITRTTEEILDSVEISWKHAFTTALGIADSTALNSVVFGPAGQAMKLVFAGNGAMDAAYQIGAVCQSINAPYVTIHAPGTTDSTTVNGVSVNLEKGQLDTDTVLNVYRVVNTENVSLGQATQDIKKGELYNIAFTKNTQPVQPNGTVTVRIPIPDYFVTDACTVFRQEKNGTWTPLKARLEGNYVTFETDHFSLYSVVNKDKGMTTYSKLPFSDVRIADWFYNDVKYVYEKGMMSGTAADVFAPNATTTRAMIVTILYRLEGSPAVTGTSAFVDVPAGQWYTDAVNWAAANQIVKGTSATTFAPNDSITREQMAAILYRYAQYKGYDVTKKADLSGYSDNGQVSAYAKDALAWANAAKLINGVTNTTLAPQGNATRAQVSAILHRFCDGVVK